MNSTSSFPFLIAATLIALLVSSCTTAQSALIKNVGSFNEIIVVPSGQVKTVYYELETGQRMEGKITVLGSSTDDVAFLIKDPFGNVVSNAGIVRGTRQFAVIANTTGTYNIVFDNSYALFTSKQVDLTFQVWSR